MRAGVAVSAALAGFALAGTTVARAATLVWKGHTWQLTSGGMAGVCQGNPNNVTVDAAGYLHVKISHNNGVWSASELFTTDKLGFGTLRSRSKRRDERNAFASLAPAGGSPPSPQFVPTASSSWGTPRRWCRT